MSLQIFHQEPKPNQKNVFKRWLTSPNLAICSKKLRLFIFSSVNKLGIQQDQEKQPFLIYIGTWQLIGTSTRSNLSVRLVGRVLSGWSTTFAKVWPCNRVAHSFSLQRLRAQGAVAIFTQPSVMCGIFAGLPSHLRQWQTITCCSTLELVVYAVFGSRQLYCAVL